MLVIKNISAEAFATLLSGYQLKLVQMPEGAAIPGSYWGDSEAGLVQNQLLVRPDTPVHSALHEACHYICMDNERRTRLDTDAGGDYEEENAVCYLQILLSAQVAEMGRQRMFDDMDAWGYTFRLGSSRAWFEQDAEDALQWLQKHDLVDEQMRPKGKLRR